MLAAEKLTGHAAEAVAFGTEAPYLQAMGMDVIVLGPGDVACDWLRHQGVWNYDAAFAAHVYLWAGLQGWARRTFVGFLNHASPLYCWREEQPTRGSLNADYNGDMPHNWASAMCVLYMRNMLAP